MLVDGHGFLFEVMKKLWSLTVVMVAQLSNLLTPFPKVYTLQECVNYISTKLPDEKMKDFENLKELRSK